MPLLADLSVTKIDIDHNFSGLDILLFGTRKEDGEIIVVVKGPKKNYIIRKKEQIFGMWLNKDAVKIDDTYSFYHSFTSAPLTEVDFDVLSQLEIGLENIKPNFPYDITFDEYQNNMPTKLAFFDAFKKLQIKNSSFSDTQPDVYFWGDSLFRTVIPFPKNIKGGIYNVGVYLVDAGVVHSFQSFPIKVQKVGFEELVYDKAHNDKWLYAFICVFTAFIAGAIANIFFAKR